MCRLPRDPFVTCLPQRKTFLEIRGFNSPVESPPMSFLLSPFHICHILVLKELLRNRFRHRDMLWQVGRIFQDTKTFGDLNAFPLNLPTPPLSSSVYKSPLDTPILLRWQIGRRPLYVDGTPSSLNRQMSSLEEVVTVISSPVVLPQ